MTATTLKWTRDTSGTYTASTETDGSNYFAASRQGNHWELWRAGQYLHRAATLRECKQTAEEIVTAEIEAIDQVMPGDLVVAPMPAPVALVEQPEQQHQAGPASLVVSQYRPSKSKRRAARRIQRAARKQQRRR